MKNIIKLIGIIAIAAVIGFSFITCEEAEEGPPTSVDDYAYLEPEMAPNSSRATARRGATTEIEIPDYLSSGRAAVGAATFTVHEDDMAIAEIVSQNGSTCSIRGRQIGSARIIVTVGGESATVIIAVTPGEDFYELPAGQVRQVGQSTSVSPWWNSNMPETSLPSDLANYTSEPTYQLAWNWRNPTQSYGASSDPCGIDILGYYVDPTVANRRGWVKTTYGYGGWHYDLNGVYGKMTDGKQTEGNLKLELTPEFIYDRGVPYLQITHKLTNTGNERLTGVKFGASADIMIYGNDRAPLIYLPYGALMTNEHISGGISYLPTMKLRLICQGV